MATAAVIIALAADASCGGSEESGPRVRLILEPEQGVEVEDLDAALDGARRIIERRAEEFDVPGAEVSRLGSDQLGVQLPGIDPEEAKAKIGRTGLLQFCEPVIDESGNVAVVRQGTAQYEPQTCRPVRDVQGNIVVQGGTVTFVPWARSDNPAAANNPPADQIVWQPVTGDLNGVSTELTGRFLKGTSVVANQDRVQAISNPWLLLFEWNSDGSEISGDATERLAQRNYPMASFLDGDPVTGEDQTITAPRVQSKITSAGVITGLSRDAADELSTLLNNGAFPVPMRVVQVREEGR